MKRPDLQDCYLIGLHIAHFHEYLEIALKAPKMSTAARSLARASNEALAIPKGIKS